MEDKDKEKAHSVAERHVAMKKDCAKECLEVGKLKRHITAIYIVLTFLAVIGVIAISKFENMVLTDNTMKAQIEAIIKRLDVQRTDINRQDDRVDALVKELSNGRRRKD